MLKRGRRSFQRSVLAQMPTPPKVLLLLLLAPSFEAFYNSHPDENRELPNPKQEERTSRNLCLEVMNFRTPGQEPFKILLTFLRYSKPNHLHPDGLICCQKRNCKENQSMNSSRLVSDGSMKILTRHRRLKPWKVQRLLRLIKRTGEDINNNNNNKQDQILKTKFVTSLAKRTSEDSSNNLEQTMKKKYTTRLGKRTSEDRNKNNNIEQIIKKKYTTRLGKRTTGDKSIYSNTNNLEVIMKKQYTSRLGKRTPGDINNNKNLDQIPTKKYTSRLGKRTTGDNNNNNLDGILKTKFTTRHGKRGEKELQILKRDTEELPVMKKRMEMERFRMMGKKAIMLRMGKRSQWQQ